MRGPLISFSTGLVDCHAGWALAKHVEALLLASGADWSGVEIRACTSDSADPAELLAATAAGGSLPCPVVSLDLPAALMMAHARQHLLLRDTAAELEALLSTPGDADLTLSMLRVLRHAENLVVFDPGAAEHLRHLGYRVRAVAPRPALAPGGRPSTPVPRSVLVINHLGGLEAAEPVVALMRRVVGDATLVGVAESPAPSLASVLPWHAGHPGHALAHVHIGLPLPDTEAPRLVDSFACRRPVLLHLPGGGGVRSAPPPIAHETDGLITTNDIDLIGGLTTLLNDHVFSSILIRNAERRLHAFNQECAAVIRASVPELFACLTG